MSPSFDIKNKQTYFLKYDLENKQGKVRLYVNVHVQYRSKQFSN